MSKSSRNPVLYEPGNVLIANFMDDIIGVWMAYHREWDWLMPVVEKIENIFKTKDRIPSFKISAQSVWFYLPDHSVKLLFHAERTPTAFYEVAGCYSESVEIVKFDTKIEAVYYVVVKFIEWYNNENN